MAMQLFQTTTVGAAGVAAVDFTNIPNTGKDLLILVSSRADNFNGKLTFNNSSSNYAYREAYGTGNSTFTNNSSGGGFINILALHEPKDFNGSNNTVGIVSNARIYIPNYAQTVNKTVSAETVIEIMAQESYQNVLGARWTDTSAITSVKIETTSGSILQYSTFSLYIIS